MLKRRPSKRFVLAETGEESAWNTTTDNDSTQPPPQPPQPPPPQIEVGITTTVTNTEDEAEIVPSTPNVQLLTVPQPIKSGMK